MACPLQGHHILDQRLHAKRIRMLHREPESLAFGHVTHIARGSAGEEVAALGDALDLFPEDQRSRLIDSLDRLHGIAPEMHRARLLHFVA